MGKTRGSPRYDTSFASQDRRERAVLVLLDHTPVNVGSATVNFIWRKAKLDQEAGFEPRNAGELLRRLEKRGQVKLDRGPAQAGTRYIYGASITTLGTQRLDGPPYTPTVKAKQPVIVMAEPTVSITPTSIDTIIRAIVQDELQGVLAEIGGMITTAVKKAFD